MQHWKYLVRKSLRLIDYDVVRLGPASSLGRHLALIFERFGINCVLDVGGHAGEHGAYLRELGYAGHIVSFEPVAASFEKLQRRASQDGKWKACHFALGSVDGSQSIRVSSATVLNSFHAPTSYGKELHGTGLELDSEETVQIRRLDSVLEDSVRHVKSPRIFLKMDTQGWDLEVLRGAEASLPSIFGVQSEAAVKPVYEGAPGYLQVLSFLTEKGFAVSGLFPATCDQNLTLVEMDCVAIRPSA